MVRAGAAPGDAVAGDAVAGGRRIRADAARNRRRIVDAAEQTFADEGIAVPIDRVAERAGVGVGTLYRHFPTKEALFEAIVVDRIDRLLETSRAAGASGEAFFDFLDRLADEVCRKHDLFDALAHAGLDVKAACKDKIAELERGLDALRRRAVDAGLVRPDVTTEQVLGLVVGVSRGLEASGGSCSYGPLLAIVYDGLRAPGRPEHNAAGHRPRAQQP